MLAGLAVLASCQALAPTPHPPGAIDPGSAHTQHTVHAAPYGVVRRHLRHRRKASDDFFPGMNIASSLIGGEFTSLPVHMPAADSTASSSSSRRTQGAGSRSSSSASDRTSDRTSDSASSSRASRPQSTSENGSTSRERSASSTSSSPSSSAARTSSSSSDTPSSSAARTTSAAGGAGDASTTRPSRTRSEKTPTSDAAPSASTTVKDLTQTDSRPASEGNAVVTSQVSVMGTPTSSPSPPPKKENHTGLIAGVSTAGGVVLLALLGAVLAKLFGHRIKRYFRNEEIKWPEMQQDTAAASAPLPARHTGGAGFDMGNETDDEFGEHEMRETSLKPADSFGNASMLPSAAVLPRPVQYPPDAYVHGDGAHEVLPATHADVAPPTVQSGGLVAGAPMSHVPVPHEATAREVPLSHAPPPTLAQPYDTRLLFPHAPASQTHLDVEPQHAFETHSQATDSHGYPVSAIADAYAEVPPYSEVDLQRASRAHDPYEASMGSPYDADAYVGQPYAAGRPYA